MLIDFKYGKEFDSVMEGLEKHPQYKELSDLDGIGKQTDMVGFSKEFFGKPSTVADVSVDSNANCEDSSVIAYEVEVSKPLLRLNSYYILYKYGKKMFGAEEAKTMVEAQFTKDLYINDFHKFATSPYSYHPHTSIVIRQNGDIKYITMESLFDLLKEDYFPTVTPDREYFNPDGIEILDEHNKFVKLKTVLRHKTDKKLLEIETKNGLCTIVTEDHPVILGDGNEVIAKHLKIGDRIKPSDSTLKIIGGKSQGENYPYMIGFWLGDGSARNDTVIFYQKNIVEHKIFQILERHSKVYLDAEFRKAIIHDRPFYEAMASLGRLSHERSLPKDILSWKEEDIAELLCGLIDAEGTVQPTGSINIRMNSFALIQQVSELAKALGLENVSSRFIGKHVYKGSYKTNRDMYKVSFRLPLEKVKLFKGSVKVNRHIDDIIKPIHKDGRFETTEVYKIQEYTDERNYVYDVTTETGTFHSQGMIQHNCFNFSCLDTVFMGLPFVHKIKSNPPKHLSSYVGQMVQFITYASNSVAGAVGLADFFLCCSWYITDSMSDSDIKQELQQFIFSVNQPFRGGHQSAFTNVSLFDDNFLDKMCQEYAFPDGTHPDKDKVKRLQRLYMELMNNTLSNTPVTFPVTTACFSVDQNREVLDGQFLAEIVEANKDYGWINIYAGSTSTLSSCCRLRSEADHEYFNSFGAGGTKIGSMSVCTLNLPRLAYKAVNDVLPIDEHSQQERIDWFVKSVRNLAVTAGYINQVKRHVVEIRAKNGNLPLYTLGYMASKKQYSTCGLNGINEAVEILGYSVLTEEGQAIINQILDTVNQVNNALEQQFKVPFNAEQTPSENSAIKLAQADKILGYNKDDYDLYSNQFIPLTVQADLFDRVGLQGKFDSKMTGGAILHVNIGEKVTDNQKMEDFLRGSIRAGVIYQAINYVLNVCEQGHITVGSKEICTTCGGQIVDKLTRVVGFLTNVKNWHKIRRTEDFPNRQFY